MAPDDAGAFFVPAGIGHNGGPPLDPGADWRKSREIALARLARAQALGMSYREYTAVLLDKGVHL